MTASSMDFKRDRVERSQDEHSHAKKMRWLCQSNWHRLDPALPWVQQFSHGSLVFSCNSAQGFRNPEPSVVNGGCTPSMGRCGHAQKAQPTGPGHLSQQGYRDGAAHPGEHRASQSSLLTAARRCEVKTTLCPLCPLLTSLTS